MSHHEIHAKLTGREEVPPVKTCAYGKFKALVSRCTFKYKIGAFKIKKVTEAHLHLGKPGENGPIIAVLFHACKPTDGLLLTGKIEAKNLRGPLKGKCLKALYHEIKRGNVYVNVHTDEYPNGELRGQLPGKH